MYYRRCGWKELRGKNEENVQKKKENVKVKYTEGKCESEVTNE